MKRDSNTTDERFRLQLHDSGVTVVVAAGNDADDAYNYSPACVRQAITVASSNIEDAKVGSSNYGPAVDIFAAGWNVISTWNDGSTKMLSGTSMATAHVAGFAAYLLGLDSTTTPAQVAHWMVQEKSLKNVLVDVREFFLTTYCMFDLRTLKLVPLVAALTANRLLNSDLLA